ncbi:hypothetical protein SDC9_124059 [bioreactor metagenome]|uniref:WG repeat-containing protein n=1 Tax=bioreactor metagenome TaxID=1076179 RepID=A0A645CJC9_9ZZZZ
MPLVKQNPSTAIYDAYGRQVNFNGGIYGIIRMTFQNEILLTKPLVYYNDTGKIQDDYDFNNKLFYIDSSFATITTGSLYADNFGTRYLGFSNAVFGYPALIME